MISLIYFSSRENILKETTVLQENPRKVDKKQKNISLQIL